jgi:tripartite-type tricarboxylate transporter receptor subunit TctC
MCSAVQPVRILASAARPPIIACKREETTNMGDFSVRSRLLVLFLALAACCGPAGAQDWPQRTVTIVVPFSAGSTPDSITAHRRAPRRLGQPVVVENRPGASGNTGTAAVAKAAPDGYTLGVSIVGPLVINAILFPKMPYDVAKEIAPVTILASQPSVLVAHPEPVFR